MTKRASAYVDHLSFRLLEQAVLLKEFDQSSQQILNEIGATMLDSQETIKGTTTKRDFQLMKLGNMKVMHHLSENKELDLTRPLPRYWFDPLDNLDSSSVKDLLALTEEYHQNATWLHKVEFAAGTFFVTCNVEKQGDAAGGGKEYLLLRLPDLKYYYDGAQQLQ